MVRRQFLANEITDLLTYRKYPSYTHVHNCAEWVLCIDLLSVM